MSQTPPPLEPVQPPPQSYPPGPQANGRPGKKGAGLAIAALVLGICSFIPLLGVLTGITALVLGIVALAKKTAGQGMAIAGIALGVVGGIVAFAVLPLIFLPALMGAQQRARDTSSLANLKGIGTAVAIYAQVNGDASPPDLETLVEQGILTKEELAYPGAETGRFSDYFYYARPSRGLYLADDPSQAILACERGDVGREDERSAVFLDLHVEKLTNDQFRAKLSLPDNRAFADALRRAEGP